jgi:sec-independent protein translocase protein TatA
MRLSAWHVVLLVAVIVLLFGAQKLPVLAKSVGQSLKIFKQEVQDLTGDNPPGTGQGGTLAPPDEAPKA